MPPRNEAQAVSLAEAIIAMTRNSAIQIGEFEQLGSIAEGKKADLVLMKKDLFEQSPSDIHQTPVAMTMVGGEVVHRLVSN